ncbi:MAG: short-chain fatty acyl-CoA regulator family protein [Pseudomonadota bacterium]|nr:short-chain fatty acyl-CoA regulator family protein [Pseudomonadota bacterium]|tara:strand:+ start:533 stop:1954 length:1422 start_codon:yes stop_codon:yes gene_type:complete
MEKAFVGSKLRQLRRSRNQTQADMAATLGISAAYVNMLEKNQRSLSVTVLMALSDQYGIDWKDLVTDNSQAVLSELRAAIQDPFFSESRPDLDELRGAISHAPALVQSFLNLYRNHHATLEKMMHLDRELMPESLLRASPGAAIYDFFRTSENHFEALERAAEALAAEEPYDPYTIQQILQNRLLSRHGYRVVTSPVEEMPDTLRLWDEAERVIQLSAALDHQNRTFQLAHVLCLIEYGDTLRALTEGYSFASESHATRCEVELANYFAAALLMPYEAFLSTAEQTRYDLDRLAATFAVSLEQAAQRLTTLQRDGRRGVPFFFLRIDKAGNVTKRFNATSFSIAEHGGACPVWNVHTAFRTPGVILPQRVELPDGQRFFTVSRTTERPVYSVETQDRRLAIALGCAEQHAERVIYASGTGPASAGPASAGGASKIGINCHLCPRHNCGQRAHDPIVTELSTDTKRRGETRYES